jgi:hypothetical protein
LFLWDTNIGRHGEALPELQRYEGIMPSVCGAVSLGERFATFPRIVAHSSSW